MRWYTGAVLLLILALAFQAALLAYAMYALLGIMLVSRYMARAWAVQLEAERVTSYDDVEIGQRVAVAVTIRNTGRLPIVWVLLEDVLPSSALRFNPPSLAVQGRRLELTKLAAGERKTFLYQVTCNRRGFYQIGPLVAETGDLFGLHRRYRLLTEPTYLTVRPEIVPLEGYDIASRRPVGEVRLAHRLFEDPTRLAGCRAYQAGDPLRRIHWPATARTGSLQTKIFDPSSVAGATILLDLNRNAFETQHEPVRSELAITTAASLSAHILRLGQQVGLVSNGRDAAARIRNEGWQTDARTRSAARQRAEMRDGEDRLRPLHIPAARTPMQLDTITALLARIELNLGLTLPDLVRETAHHMPHDTSVIAILSRVEDQELAAIEVLRQHGYAVTALINLFEDHDFLVASSRLRALSIDARHLKDHQRIHTICQLLSRHEAYLDA